MIRKLLSVVAFVGAPLFLLAGVASARDYVPAAVAANNSGSSAATRNLWRRCRRRRGAIHRQRHQR